MAAGPRGRDRPQLGAGEHHGAAGRPRRRLLHRQGRRRRPDHHLERELRAHQLWLRPWTSRRPSAGAGACRWRRQDLGDPIPSPVSWSWRPTQRATRTSTARRESSSACCTTKWISARIDDGYEERETAKSLAWLDQPHRISPSVEARLRAADRRPGQPNQRRSSRPTATGSRATGSSTSGVVSVIDFGRADLRPASTDFARAGGSGVPRHRDSRRPSSTGYGSDPREPAAWQRIQAARGDRRRGLGVPGG